MLRFSILAFCMLLAWRTPSAEAQIRDDLDSPRQETASAVDDAIAHSERYGEVDTPERRALIEQAHEWYLCAKNTANVLFGSYEPRLLSRQDANAAVLRCYSEKQRTYEAALVYSKASGSPGSAELKARAIVVSLEDPIAERVMDDRRREVIEAEQKKEEGRQRLRPKGPNEM